MIFKFAKRTPFFFFSFLYYRDSPKWVSEKCVPWLFLLMVAPWHNSASWSCANGGPGSVNTFISCRLTAAAAEQKTSSRMNQMKQQSIPPFPWMTCSSDPESAFASLALSQSTPAQLQRARLRACMFSGYPVLMQLFFSNHCLLTMSTEATILYQR